MSLCFHPAVQHDINEVLGYYSERSSKAADGFWDALQERFDDIAANPDQFGFIQQARGLRRVRLQKFPYLAIYYQSAAGVKITCVKHEKRHPLQGLFRRGSMNAASPKIGGWQETACHCHGALDRDSLRFFSAWRSMRRSSCCS